MLLAGQWLPPVSIKTISICVLWYLVLSFTAQVTKVVMVELSYPLFLSQFQFLVGALLSLLMIQLSRKVALLHQVFPIGTVPVDSSNAVLDRRIFIKVLPLGVFQFTAKYLSLCATLLIPVATVASVKALSPLLIVAGYRLFYKVHFPLLTYLLLVPLVAGVITIITADAGISVELAKAATFTPIIDEVHFKGLLFCISSTVVMVTQQIYGKELITWDSSAISNPASLVLNTDKSRAVTPEFGPDQHTPSLRQHESSSSDFLLPLSAFGKKGNTLRLPYSVSDLSLDEKKEAFQSRAQHYDMEVQEGKKIINPFRALASAVQGVRKPDKFTIIFYISLIGFAFSFSGFFANEAVTMYKELTEPAHFEEAPEPKKKFVRMFVLILLSSVSHFCQTLLAFILLGMMPALSYSIASMMKRIVIIVVSIIFATQLSQGKWFGVLTGSQIVGLVLISLGLYFYDRWGSRSLKENRV
uniref:Sugar phosphate transporter domain-containing protein n=1 Tax=Candidozyma auris TaxID=498019 RepID=A0A0L0P020_CANAR